jgi:hypothetical protein
MYRAEDEKRADEKLGEAVVFLLSEEMAINEAALLLRLQQMLMTEKNAASRKATFSAIRKAEAALCTREKENGRVLNSSGASGFAGAYRH